MSPVKRAFLQNVIFWCVLVGLCYLGLRYALPCFLPLVLGALLAAALHPAATGLCRRLGWRYRPCAVLVAVAALTVLGLLLWGIGGLVVRQSSALLPQLPLFYRQTVLPLIETLQERLQSLRQGRAAGGWGISADGDMVGRACLLPAVYSAYLNLYGALHHLFSAGLRCYYGSCGAFAAGQTAAPHRGIQTLYAGRSAKGAVCIPLHYVYHLR